MDVEIVARNEKGYDEMVYFLGQALFTQKVEDKKTYYVRGDEKVELISEKNSIKIINLEEGVQEILSHIATTEARAF